MELGCGSGKWDWVTPIMLVDPKLLNPIHKVDQWGCLD